MEISDKQLERILDELLDDVALTAQVTDINSNKAVIGNELLESDKKRWSMFRIAMSVILLLVTTIGYLYYSGLSTNITGTMVKVAVIEDNAKEYVTKKDLVECVEKRFTYLETQMKHTATHKELLDAKDEIMKLILKLHSQTNSSIKKEER